MNGGRGDRPPAEKQTGRGGSTDRRFASWFDLALQTGLTLALSVLAGVFGGHWLDTHWGTTPLFTIIGVLWGAGGGTAWVIIRVKQYADARERDEAEKREQP